MFETGHVFRRQTHIIGVVRKHVCLLAFLLPSAIKVCISWLVWHICLVVTALVISTNLIAIRLARLVSDWWPVAGLLMPTQPGHPSVGRCSGYWRWFRPSPGEKRSVLRSGGTCYFGLLAYVYLFIVF